MAGMFRRGRRRPTFDTAVEFVPVNRIRADRSGGYRRRVTEAVWGAWSGPTPSAVTDSPEFAAFVPPTDEGHECQATGAMAWFVEGGERVVVFVGVADLDPEFAVKKRAASETGTWVSQGTQDASYVIADANRPQGSKARFVRWTAGGANPRTANLPAHTPAGRDGPYGILVDTAEGQTLITTRFNPEDCLEWTRTFTAADPAVAVQTHYADVKDVASRESVVDGALVATRTKSLIFAHATLRPLLESSGSLAKDWKVRIGGREMDITQVLDSWAPNLYAKIVVEDRR